MTNFQSENDIELLNKISEKLALDSTDKLNRKGFEFLRLLKVKRGAGLANMSDSCAVVLCLHLAAETLGCTFDKSIAIKLASVSKRNYTILYHTVKKLLGLDQPVTIKDLCLKLECSQVSGLAQRIIDRYVRNREEGVSKCPPIDLTHPMYACAAILAACRHKKVHVKRGPLVETCRIKAKELDRLAGELATLVEQSEKPLTRKRGHHLLDLIDQNEIHGLKELSGDIKNGIPQLMSQCTREDENEDSQESYEDWKTRLLAEATNG